MPYLISRVRDGGQVNIKDAQHKVVITLDDDNHSEEVKDIKPMIKSLTTLKNAGFITVEETKEGEVDGDAEAERIEAERIEAERIEAERIEDERLENERIAEEEAEKLKNGGSDEGDGSKEGNQDIEDDEGDAITLPLEVRPEDPEVLKATIIFAMNQVIAEGVELTNDRKPQMDALRKALGFNEVSGAERDELMPFTTDPAAD